MRASSIVMEEISKHGLRRSSESGSRTNFRRALQDQITKRVPMRKSRRTQKVPRYNRKPESTRKKKAPST